MFVGLVVYLTGRGALPAEPRRGADEIAKPPLSVGERRVVISLVAIVPILTLFWIAQAQIWNTYNIWVRDHVDLVIGNFHVPVPWLQSVDGLAPLVSLPVLLLFWRWQARRGSEPDEYQRMVLGLLIFGASVMLLAAGQWVTDASGKTPILLPVAFHFASNIGWLYFAPSANSLFAGTAPRSVRGTMIGIYTLSMFFGSIISGRLGGLYEHLSPALFWTIHASVAVAGGAVLWIVGIPLRRIIGKIARPAPLALIS
jgi:POT family proton-dependent oligopeptide transporter